MPEAIIFFDGVCNLCNGAVQFIIKHDPKGYFHFSPIQSEFAKKVLRNKGIQTETLKTFYLLEDGKLYQQSTAPLKISRHLKGFWPSCQLFLVIPKFIRDAIYQYIARHRYQWFGKRKECMVPTEALKARFIRDILEEE